MKNRWMGRQLIKFRRIRGRIVPVVMKAAQSADDRVPLIMREAFAELQQKESRARSLIPVAKKIPFIGRGITKHLVNNVNDSRMGFMVSLRQTAANPTHGPAFSRYARTVMNATKKGKK